MTFVSWGLKQLLGTQKMITIQAFVLKKQKNKEAWLRDRGVGQLAGGGMGGWGTDSQELGFLELSPPKQISCSFALQIPSR